MKSIILIFLISLNVFSQNRESNIQSVKQTKADKTRKEPEYINQINELMTKSYERGLFNGNILVAKKGKIVYQKSFGFTDETRKTPLTKNAIFNFGSIVKQFNAVAIMMLVERGQLNLDDPISKYNLDLPKWS